MLIEIITNTCFSPQICIKNDTHSSSQMTYLFIESVSVDHIGTYTCRTTNNKTKSVNIHVQGW